MESLVGAIGSGNEKVVVMAQIMVSLIISTQNKKMDLPQEMQSMWKVV